MDKVKNIIALGGPTASGKTNVAIQLAQHYQCSIVSADSRQIYQEMTIGTAKPTLEELSQARHYLIHQVSIHDDYSVGSYISDVEHILKEEFKQRDLIILVGGSGLYIKAITEGIDHFPKIKKEDQQYYIHLQESKGIETLQNELKEKDQNYYHQVDIHNPHRLIRALSVIKGSGRPYSSFLNQKKVEQGRRHTLLALQMPREDLYQRIDQRVDTMMKDGLLNEVKELYRHRHLKSLNTVGYKELFAYLEGICTLHYAVDKIKQHSRNYAKRQITWFKNQQDFIHFHPRELSRMIQYIDKRLSSSTEQ